MSDFLRVQDGVAVELWSAPDDLIPFDCFPEELAATFYPKGDANVGWLLENDSFTAPAAAPAPITDVSSAQAKIQLSRSGFLLPVKASVEAIGGEVEIWFTDARTWQRNNPHVIEIGAGLTLSPAEIDDLFREAAKIDA